MSLTHQLVLYEGNSAGHFLPVPSIYGTGTLNKLKIKEIIVRDGGYTYRTFMVEGKGKFGERIRKKFKNRELALAFMNEKEMEIANSDFQVRKIVSRLPSESIVDAELAMAKLGGRATLSRAAEFFDENYREPSVTKLLSEVVDAFLIEREKASSRFYVRPRSMKQCRSVWGQFKAFISTYHGGDILVHKLNRSMIIGFLERTDNPKTFCNWHSELNQFFLYCLDADRMWVTSNPIPSISRPRVDLNKVPVVLPVQKVEEIMRYISTFAGTGKRHPGVPGQLVPYFALAFFAGIRTDDYGELVKIGKAPDAFPKIIDLKRKVIRIPPDISKTRQPRPVKIRENLAAWLRAFRGPILPPNRHKDIAHVRRKFGIGRDVMRHTWYSAHVIAFRSVSDAALEGGSSEWVVKRHYLNMAHHTEAEARRFWRIAPAGRRGVTKVG